MNKESIKQFLRSRVFAGAVTGIGIALIAIVIFETGVYVGFHQAQFSSRWGENYERNFGGPGMPGGFDHGMPDSHGAFGQIVNVSSTTMTISNPKKQEQEVLISAATIIRDHENTVAVSDLAAGTNVVVLGEPNDQGQINARLIRIMPALPLSASSTRPQ